MKKRKRIIALIGATILLCSSVLSVGAADTDTDETQDAKQQYTYLKDGTAKDKDLDAVPEDLKEYVGKGRTLFEGWEDYSSGIDTAILNEGAIVTITPKEAHRYGSWGTNRFDVSGRTGYCAQPNSSTPSGNYRAFRLNNDLIKVLLMCAPGGPLDGKIGGFPAGSIFYDPNVAGGNVYANAHACIGYVYSGQTTGLGYSYLAGIERMIQLARNVQKNGTGAYSTNANWDNWEVFVAPNTQQDIVWLESKPQKGSCKVLKSSANPEITNGNACYSLKGATYGIYRNPDCSDSSWVATMTTNENGESNTVTLDAGTYYIREGAAPKGFALNQKVYTAVIKTNQTYVFKTTDKPTIDPVGILLGKVDKETNQNKPQGSASLEGALFTVKFYAGVQSDSDPAASGKTATRSWVFRTDEDGYTNYANEYLESGDDLYILPSGTPGLPIGTLTIQETKAPEGYLINQEVFVRQITSDNKGAEFVYTYNQPSINEQSLNLDVVKKENGKDYLIKGVVFEHILPDGTTETLTTDENGSCSFKALGYGQHKIREVSAPDEYTVNDGVVTFTVEKDNSITVNSNTSKDNSMKFEVKKSGIASLTVEDKLRPYTMVSTKVNEKGQFLEGAEFTLYSDVACTKEITKVVTDENGKASFPQLEVGIKYYLKETKAPEGYRIPKDRNGKDYIYEVYTNMNNSREYEYYVNGDVHKESTGDYAITGTAHERIVNLKIVNQTEVQLPETGTHSVLLLTLIGTTLMLTAIVCKKRIKK